MRQVQQEGANEMGYSKVLDENLEKNIHEIGEKNAKIRDAVWKYALQIQDIVKPLYNTFDCGKEEMSLPKGYIYSENPSYSIDQTKTNRNHRLFTEVSNLEKRKIDRTNFLSHEYTIDDAANFLKDIENGLIDAMKGFVQKQNETRDSILDMVEKLEVK